MYSNDNNKQKELLINSVLLNETTNLDKKIEEEIKVIKREKVTKPIIYIGAGTCGLVA